MNLITALTLSLVAVIVGCQGLSMYLTEKAKKTQQLTTRL